MNENESPQTPIYVETLALGPHKRRVILLPKIPIGSKKHKTFIWVVAALLIGTSIVSFLFDMSERATAYVYDYLHRNETPSIASDGTFPSLGSDDEVVTKSTLIDGTYGFADATAAPRTSALAYLVGDVKTGEIIIEKNPEFVLPIASVTKLMTAIVSREKQNQHDYVTVTKSSINTYGTQGGLFAGEKILVTDLIYPLLLESSNDAAEVLAEGYGRDKFLKEMNKKAKELLMKNTNYADPSGLIHKNVSTVRDLFLLAKYIDKDTPDIWDITRVRQYAILKHSWGNGNRLLRKASFIGGKNGYTDEAARTTVSVFEVPFKSVGTKEKFKRRIVIIVLKSNDRDGDVDKLLRYIETKGLFKEKVEENLEDEDYSPMGIIQR